MRRLKDGWITFNRWKEMFSIPRRYCWGFCMQRYPFIFDDDEMMVKIYDIGRIDDKMKGVK